MPYTLAVIGGALIFLGWAGFGVWPLELVALVPLFAALELVRTRSLSSSLKIGWLCGTVAIAGGYHWMLEFTQRFSGFGLVLTLSIFAVFSIWLGLQFGVQAVLYTAVRRRGWSVIWAALPPFLATEWLFPKLFPVHLGHALIHVPPLAQTADLGGPLMLSLLVGVTNIAAFELLGWARRGTDAPVHATVAAIGIVAATLAYGWASIRQVDAQADQAPRLSVGVVQVNMGVFEKQEQMLEAHRRYLEQSAALEADGPVDLLVWPESAYNHPRFGRALPLIALEVRQGLRAPLLFGALSVDHQEPPRRLFNSVLLADSRGIVGERYDKTKLAMFGEYLPFGERFPKLYLLSRNTGMFSPGKHWLPFSVGPWRISTPICYEAILPDLVRDMVNVGDPHLLVNLSNDAWFGNTQGPWIHLRLAQLRAIEHRRYLVRATNSGVSAIVDPAGRVVAQTQVGTRENLRGTVGLRTGKTLYSRFGGWLGWLAALLTLVPFARKPMPTR